MIECLGFNTTSPLKPQERIIGYFRLTKVFSKAEILRTPPSYAKKYRHLP